MERDQDLLADKAVGGWRAFVSGLYSAAFVAVILSFFAFMLGVAFADKLGAPSATATAAYPLAVSHGRTVYLPAWEGEVIALLGHAALIGLPSLFFLAFVLHFGLGVRIFGNLPTGWEDS